jgi:hypothetical protein
MTKLQLKISGSKGRTVDVDPGVTLRITSEKLSDKSMRKEVSETLTRHVPRLIEKILGEQAEIDDYTDPEEPKKTTTTRRARPK